MLFIPAVVCALLFQENKALRVGIGSHTIFVSSQFQVTCQGGPTLHVSNDGTRDA
jgi:hypothetical protein